MRYPVAVIILLAGISQAMARTINTYIFGSFLPAGLTNRGVITEFTNELNDDLSRYNFMNLDSGNLAPDYIISGEIRFEENVYDFDILITDYNNKTKQWRDHLYTTDIGTPEGTRDAAKAAAGRIVKLVMNERPIPYREKHLYRRENNALITNLIPVSSFILSFIDVPMKYPYGFSYDFPLSFGIDFFQFGYTWFFPGTSFGIGAGTKILDIHGETAGNILPVIIYIPVYIAPSSYGNLRNDLYITGEWGFLFQQYSYLDLSLKLILNGLNLSAGWLMLPSYSGNNFNRNYYETFYASITFSFGSYVINWK